MKDSSWSPPMQSPEKYFTPEAMDSLRRCIQENDGMEIFCLGTLDEASKVATIRVLARGNKISAPAILEAVEFGAIAIHNHPTGNLTPSDNDVLLASEFGALGVGSFIVDNHVKQLRVLVEPFASPDVHELLDDPLVQLFTLKGPLARKSKDFEYRPQQESMVRDVVHAFNKKKVALIEAGTGVGKSMAYLVPVVYWALENKQKVVVSTNTINLQEQLIHKDIPFIRESLNKKFSAILLKGRSNYLCLRKAADFKKDTARISADNDQKWEIDLILTWMEQTRDGSLSELNVIPSSDVWDSVCSESDNCTRARCPYFSRCFFYQSRRRAAQAQIIVTNHHLLMADMAVREQTGRKSTGILPAFHKLILDEAHHLVDVATSYLGLRLTPFSFYRNLGRLQNSRYPERGMVPGIYARLFELINQKNQKKIALIHKFVDTTFTPARKKCQEELEQIFEEITLGILRCEEQILSPGEELKKRISPIVESTPLWQDVVEPGVTSITNTVGAFVAICQDLLKKLRDLDGPTCEKIDSRLMDTEALVLRLRIHLTSLDEFLNEKENECRWMELGRRKKGHRIAFRQAPLDVSHRLKELLFDEYESVILTSATLAIDHSFDFFKKRIGLNLLPGERLLENVLDSPFDYPNRVMLCLPTDIPEPNNSRFMTALAGLIRETITVTGGRAFVLFTSYGLLNGAFNLLENPLLLNGFTCFRQGRMNRHALLEEFKKTEKAVLFATDSFWEGVDVKGESLQSVILTKLPFQVPTEPIVEARMEKIRKDGGQPFYDYSLPHAVIKLKQGFGRLIRSKEDWGLVVISDPRVMTRSYGRTFLRSLPGCRERRLETQKLVEEMRLFHGQFISN